MHKYSQKAEAYVVSALYGEEAGTKTFVVKPETTVRVIFETLWPLERRGEHELMAGIWGGRPLPFRIELNPDINSIPHVDEPAPFGTKPRE